jgi:predicted GTPase
VFAYSDVLHETVMHCASRALACGADFVLLGPKGTMVKVRVPVVAVSAVRTGCGKSQVARMLAGHLRERGLRVSVVRHPMPYGDLLRQRCQRFASLADLAEAECTVEEREEYEPHIAAGAVVFAGVDYTEILERAEAEADVLVWDGGNNDFPFVRPDVHIVVADALRPGHVMRYHPGEAVARMADIICINKVNAATPGAVAAVREEMQALARNATVVLAASRVLLDDPEAVRGKRVLVIDDGPTLTHGGMPYGAGYVGAMEAGAAECIDPRVSAVPAIAKVYATYPALGHVLPALGYSGEQLHALVETANASQAEVIVNGSPADLAALGSFRVPVIRARYSYQDAGEPHLADLVDALLRSASESR